MSKAKQKQHNTNRIKPQDKTYKHSIISWISLVISVLAFAFSIYSHVIDQQSKPLAYYLQPTVTNFSEDVVYVDLEVIVTNGAVNSVDVFGYRDGALIEIFKHPDVPITSSSNKHGRTFSYEFTCLNNENEFLMTQYVLVGGKDGSKNLGMILYRVNSSSKTVSAGYYSFEDLLLAELDPSQEVYSKALSDYRKLVELLKSNGVI